MVLYTMTMTKTIQMIFTRFLMRKTFSSVWDLSLILINPVLGVLNGCTDLLQILNWSSHPQDFQPEVKRILFFYNEMFDQIFTTEKSLLMRLIIPRGDFSKFTKIFYPFNQHFIDFKCQESRVSEKVVRVSKLLISIFRYKSHQKLNIPF